jgi:hypothetical protein
VRARAKLLLAASLALALAALLAASAGAELTEKGGVFVHFGGGISPRALPRHHNAPIAVRIEGSVKVPAGHRPPSLSRIRIALNRRGRLYTRGLRVCRRSQIQSATPSRALGVCGPALVGSGGIVARTSLADQSPYLMRGNVLLFNSVAHGRPAILAHVFQSAPAPITNIIVFQIRRARGAFGTVITAGLPPVLEHNGYLKSIFLRLQRTYAFRGRTRSYLSAGCPAPKGFPLAIFPFARASMSFDDGRTLSATLIRTCKAKG